MKIFFTILFYIGMFISWFIIGVLISFLIIWNYDRRRTRKEIITWKVDEGDSKAMFKVTCAVGIISGIIAVIVVYSMRNE